MIKSIGFLVNLISLFSLQSARSIAYKLFSTPRTGKLKANKPPVFLAQSNRSSFVFNGLTIQCYLWNNENSTLPIVMLFHGWESNASRWEQMITYFGIEFRYICIDSMGLGLSGGSNLSVIDYSRLMDVCLTKYQPDYVVSHSLGAFALLHQLSVGQYPFIKKAILMGCLDKFQGVIDNYNNLLGYRESLKNNLLVYLESLINMKMDQYASRYFIKEIATDVLIIHDKNDEAVVLDECTVFHQEARDRGIEVFYTQGFGHSVQDPIVFDKILTYFKK
ncbi:alpha/beta hydrolase [Myroides sp. M-43]|uniref:alpha/beta hydrolase family protein n=1 Tax=Myroides oncorhynchi TaxID=2893756 RepID=UPI001E45155C|nr:alpha/beta hydrolase [Myroides oncorhynchi]MCC9043096.1 alpha/beta hydrolase [Myroides oncorhynchi]